MKIEVRFVAYNQVLETEQFKNLKEAKESLTFEYPDVIFKRIDDNLILAFFGDLYNPNYYELEEVEK